MEGYPDKDEDVDVTGVDDEQDKKGVSQGIKFVPKMKKRKPSERIIKSKLKKAVYDKDGSGSSISQPLELE